MSYPDEKFKQVLESLINPLVDSFKSAFESCEKIISRVKSVSKESTDEEYPTAKAVYTLGEEIKKETSETYEKISNRDTVIDSDSTDEKYPTTKATYNAFQKAIYTAVEQAGSITVDGGDFASISLNLFDETSEEIQDGYYISPNGTVEEGSSNFITHAIPIEYGKTYTTLWNSHLLGVLPRLWLYENEEESSAENIRNVAASTLENVNKWVPVTFTINVENAHYARINSLISMKSELMFLEGSVYPDDVYWQYGVSLNPEVKIPQLANYIKSSEVERYIPYDDITELQDDIVRLGKGTIFPTWEIGRISSIIGDDIVATNGIRTVGYIEVKDLGTLNVITSNLTAYLFEYDENKNFLISTSGSNKILTPTNENCKFVRICTYEAGATLTDASAHSEKIAVYYDGASIEFLVSNDKELSDRIEKNKIRYSYAFDDVLIESINHRGYNTIAPENTLPAFRLSKSKGFKFVECDVCLTADRVPVLLHDETINRTARNADGSQIAEAINISDITYEEALSYDFGIWKSETYKGTEIPTFEEFIVLCRDLGLYPYIELKSTTNFEQSDVDNIVDIVAKHGLTRVATYVSNSISVLSLVLNANKTARFGVTIAANLNDTFCQKVKKELDTGINEVFMDILLGYATSDNIDICERNGLRAMTYCPDTEAEILALDKRIAGVTSNILIAENVIRENSLGNAETGLV